MIDILTMRLVPILLVYSRKFIMYDLSNSLFSIEMFEYNFIFLLNIFKWSNLLSFK